MRSGAAGFTEWLLFHLWKQNESTGLCCPNILLPETVIYRWAKPFFWYFCTETGELLRKSKTKVTHKFIFQEFMDENKQIIASFMGFSDNKKDKANIATVEFFTPESFNDFIHNRDKPLSGILQKWIHPKNAQNSLIKVIWSPQFCLLEKRTNIHKLDDPKMEFYDKLVTYEGLEHNSKIDSLSAPWLVEEVQRICLGIVDHIKAVTGGNVTVARMTLFFKQDADDLLWLQFCSSLKVFDLTRSNKENEKMPQELILMISSLATEKKVKSSCKFSEMRKNRELCVGCNHLVRSEYMHNISLRLVLKFSEIGNEPPDQVNDETALVLNESSEDKCNLVPNVLRRLNPLLTNTKYEEMKKDPSWGAQEIKVCEDCYLHYTSFYAESKKKLPPRIKPTHKTETTFDLMSEISPVTNKNIDFKLKEEFNFNINPKVSQTIKNPPLPIVRQNIIRVRTHSALPSKPPSRPNSKKSETRLPLFSSESYKRATIVYGRKSAINFDTEIISKHPRGESLDYKSLKEGEFIKDTIEKLKIGLSKVKKM
ncbi:unnamed protein product [Blepharisma stoltei]|uniref:Uncharacterized protein n=1 Tax=Blepharisma stoltei TaxID=1481888 RepID=A0AAU9I9I8_9CILI|nr:unnamed protein product [Blepharisma stoltei]